MESIKAEKEIAMRRFRRLQQIGLLLRCIEAAAAILLLSYSSAHVSSAARNSGEYLYRAASFLTDHRFVFILGNTIVLTLLKTRCHSSETFAASNDVRNMSSEGLQLKTDSGHPQPQILEAPAAVQEKPVCRKCHTCRRSRSEKLERRREQPKLRRVETECHRKSGNVRSTAAQGSTGRDDDMDMDMDADEFRRKIEEFIAKHRRIRREELLSIVAV